MKRRRDIRVDVWRRDRIRVAKPLLMERVRCKQAIGPETAFIGWQPVPMFTVPASFVVKGGVRNGLPPTDGRYSPKRPWRAHCQNYALGDPIPSSIESRPLAQGREFVRQPQLQSSR